MDCIGYIEQEIQDFFLSNCVSLNLFHIRISIFLKKIKCVPSYRIKAKQGDLSHRSASLVENNNCIRFLSASFIHLLSERRELTNNADIPGGEHHRGRSASAKTEMGACLAYLQKTKEASLEWHVCGDRLEGRARAAS